jgi:hypothetical protein
MSSSPHFIIAASLGVGIQPTAIAVVEQEVLKADRWLEEAGGLRLRHLERLPVETTYPKTVDRISTLLETPEIKVGEKCGGAEVVLDITGSGRAILEIFKRADILPVVVRIIGAGQREEQVKPTWDWHVPKIELAGVLRVVFEAGRLQMAKDLELVQTLMNELREFKMRPVRIDPGDPETWRDTEFDDLVFAVALAAWRASRYVPTPQIIRERYARKPRKTASPWAA